MSYFVLWSGYNCIKGSIRDMELKTVKTNNLEYEQQKASKGIKVEQSSLKYKDVIHMLPDDDKICSGVTSVEINGFNINDKKLEMRLIIGSQNFLVSPPSILKSSWTGYLMDSLRRLKV